MAAPTLIPLLPDAPSRTLGQEDFNLKADPFIAALPPMVVNINTSLTWIGQQVTAIDGYRQAAATSAGDAATSTGNAQAQVGLAAAQVALANTARTDAQAARDSAQASALAAGAAAGLPAQRLPFTVLQINAAGNVAWSYGLPDTGAALVGQALILGTGKVPSWGYAGAQIGDILYTSRNPGTGYLPANGGIYLQSAYPVLFSQIGLIGGQRAISFTAKSLTPPMWRMGFGENGVVLGVSITAGSAGYVYRSSDNGNTFTYVSTIPNPANAIVQILHLGGSNWMFGINGGAFYLSPDNGQTFTLGSTSSGTFLSAYTDKAGTILLNTSGVVMRSINNGLSFSSLPFAICTVFSYAGAGRWIGIYPSASNNCYISDDAFSTATAKTLNGTLSGNLSFIDSDLNTGVTLIGSSNGGVSATNIAVTYDRGESFGVGIIGSAYPIIALKSVGGDTWIVLCSNSSSNELRKSSNGAKIFAQGPAANTGARPLEIIADPLKGQVILNTQNTSGAGSYSISAPALGYDGTTQFKVPTLTKQEGVNPYVRAA